MKKHIRVLLYFIQTMSNPDKAKLLITYVSLLRNGHITPQSKCLLTGKRSMWCITGQDDILIFNSQGQSLVVPFVLIILPTPIQMITAAYW